MAPPVINRMPIINSLLKWFKGDDLNIDNSLFKLHHQASTFVIMAGLIFIFLENHLDGRAIVCQGGDQYARSYCWIHGTAYVRDHLQGKATGCFVDQSRIESEEDAPVTAYYLWLPLLLTLCFSFAKASRSLWKKFLEGNLVQYLLDGGNDPQVIAKNFDRMKRYYSMYHLKFGLCELLNLVMVVLSMYVTDALLLGKFWGYGQEVLRYMWSLKYLGPEGRYVDQYDKYLHDPQCELFPTEVACYIRIGATTGAIDRANYLCILSNNLFNQKYFLVLWLWWIFLIGVSIIGLVFRLARLVIPDLSKYLLMRKTTFWPQYTKLTGAQCFVLDKLNDNLQHNLMMDVLKEIDEQTKRERLDTSLLNKSHNYSAHNPNPYKATTPL